jgi:ferric-dicitrate binding protein FerR (iron transport regulator)
MFFNDGGGHPEREMSRRTQRKLAIGAAVAVAAVILMDLIGGSPVHNWTETPAGEATIASR